MIEIFFITRDNEDIPDMDECDWLVREEGFEKMSNHSLIRPVWLHTKNVLKCSNLFTNHHSANVLRHNS